MTPEGQVVPRRGPAQPSNLNRLTESGTQDLPTHSQAFPSESVPLARPNDLCVECGHRPRAGGGQLSRCIPCIKAEAARARDSREAAEARVAATTASKPLPNSSEAAALLDTDGDGQPDVAVVPLDAMPGRR